MAEVRRATFELEGLETQQILRFEATERLSEPYEIRIEVRDVDVAFDVAGALGKDATLTLEQDGLAPRRFPGVVWGARSPDGERGDARDTTLELTIRPALSVMGLNQSTRIFQNKSVPEILEELLDAGLGPLERAFSNELGGTYAPREYCVQYQESDLDFVQRLMAEEGIFYSFDFADGHERLVLHDANVTLVELEDPELAFVPDEGGVTLARGITEFARRRRATTNAIALHDWDWTGPRSITAAGEGESVFPALESYEHGHGRCLTITGYDDGVKRYQTENSSAQARVRLEEKQVSQDIGIGRSGVVELSPGLKLTLSGHPGLGMDGEYALTEVVHRLHPESDGGRSQYIADFVCIPADVPFRPAPRPKPIIHSVQTANVVGPSGEEIHTDGHGRIAVQFHWDREGANDEHSSCWIRVRQAWAGDGWGFLFVPRIGMEVVVSFMGGDPDRPLVTGCVYNGDHPPPYSLPDEKTKSTIKTNSSKGGGGFNEYRFEDKSGSEQIFIHAQKDFNEIVEACHTTTVGGNQTNKVQGNQTQDIGDWQKENVDIDQDMHVIGKRTVTVGGKFKEDIDTGEDRTVTGGSTEQIKSGELRMIVGPSTETVSGSETRTVHGGLAEGVIGTFVRDVTGDAKLVADAAYTKTVTGALTVTTPGTMKFDAKAGVIIDAAGPVTATGGPFLEVITPVETKMAQTKKQWGVLKINAYGAKASDTTTSYSFVGTSKSATGAKAEAIAVKIDVGALKFDGAGFTAEAVVLFTGRGASKKKNTGSWIK